MKSKTQKSKKAKRNRRYRQNRRVAIFFSHGELCYLCGVRLVYDGKGLLHNSGEPPPNLFTIDHVKPVSRGGTQSVTNLKPACYQCNQKKGAKELQDLSAASSTE